MSISLFRTLVAVADTGSFRAASDVVFVTHAAVGQQMKRLESDLGVVLFDRSTKTPQLNQLGKALVPKARAVLAAYDSILDDLTGEPEMIGELVIGAVPSTIRELIPRAVKRLQSLYPNLRVRVVPALSPRLADEVRQGVIDAAVLSAPARIDPSMHWAPFAKERLVLLTSAEVTDTDPFALLRDMPYIRHTRDADVGILANEWLAQNNVEVREAMEMGSLANLASMVSHNLGVSVAPDICLPDETFRQLRKISLGDTAIVRMMGVLARSDCSKMLLVEKLHSEIVSVIAEHKATTSAQRV